MKENTHPTLAIAQFRCYLLAEVVRAFDDTGIFIIINRYPPEGSKWWKLAAFKSESGYRNQLQLAGFSKVNIEIEFKRGWIVVVAEKSKDES